MNSPFSRALKQWMANRKLTQQQLADKADVRQATVSDWVTGKAQPHPANLKALAKALGISLGALMDELSPVDDKDRPLMREAGKKMLEAATMHERDMAALIQDRIATKNKLLATIDRLSATTKDPEVCKLVEQMRTEAMRGMTSLEQAKSNSANSAALLREFGEYLSKM